MQEFFSDATKTAARAFSADGVFDMPHGPLLAQAHKCVLAASAMNGAVLLYGFFAKGTAAMIPHHTS